MSTPLPTRQRKQDDTEEFLRILKEIPLRSIEDIREEREPVVSLPVTAAGMRAERPAPSHYSGAHRRPWKPPLWRVKSWLLWHFGDLIHWRQLYEHQQHPHWMV